MYLPDESTLERTSGPRADDRDRDRQDHVLDRRAERCRHHQGQHEQRQALQDVEESLGQEVGLAPYVTGEEADDAAQDRPDQGGRDPHDQGDPRSVHDARVDVAPQVIRDEPVGVAGQRERGLRLGRDRIVGRDQVG
jgi:hypothetical protein